MHDIKVFAFAMWECLNFFILEFVLLWEKVSQDMSGQKMASSFIVHVRKCRFYFFLKWQNLPVCYCCQMLCILVQEAPSVAWTGLVVQEEAELSHLPQQGTATDLTSRILNKNFNLVAEQELFIFRFIKETCGVWLHSKLTYSSLFVLFLDRFYKHCTLAREI